MKTVVFCIALLSLSGCGFESPVERSLREYVEHIQKKNVKEGYVECERVSIKMDGENLEHVYIQICKENPKSGG